MSIPFDLTITLQGIYPVNLLYVYYPNQTNVQYFGIGCIVVSNRIKLQTIQVPAQENGEISYSTAAQ